MPEIMEISELECGFAAAMEGTQSGLDFVHGIEEKIEGLIQCIECYCSFENPASRKFSLVIFRNWCRKRWVLIPDEVKTSLQGVLFESCLEDFDQYETDERNLIANAQFALFWVTFPDSWPSFWEELVSLGGDVLLNFLSAFCTFTDMLSPDASSEFVAIKNAMREVEDDQRLLELVVSCISVDSETSFNILASLTRWVSLDAVLDEEFLRMVLDAAEESPEAVRVMQSLVERGMEPEMKDSLFEIFNIPSMAIEIVHTRDVDDALRYAIADLIEAAGIQLVESPDGLPYFQVALSLLMDDDDDVSESVAPLIHEYVKFHPELIAVVLNTTYTRLTNYFSENECREASFCELLFGIIRTCFIVDFDYALGWLVDICQSMVILAESAHCVTLLEILNEQAPQPEFMQYFEAMLELEPPLSSQQARALSSYTRFFTSVASELADDAVDEFFTCIARIAIEDPNPELTSSLLALSKRHTSKISCDQDMICSLVSTLEVNLVSAAATIIAAMQEEQFEVFQSCLTFLTEQLESDPSLSLICLKFVKTMRYVEGAPHLELVQQFLEQIMPHMITSDDSQAMFIRTCFSSLEKEGLEMISACSSTVEGALSIAAFCKAVVGCQDRETATQAMEFLLPKVRTVIESGCDVSIVNDEVVETSEMLGNFFTLALFALDEEKISEIAQLGNDILQTVQNYRIAMPIMNFAISLARIDPKPAADAFLESSMTFALSNREFDPLRPGWSQLCVSLVKLHAILIKALNDDALEAIAAILSGLQATDEMVEEYFEIMELTSRQRKDGAVKFFSDLAKFRNSLP